eukprot:gene5785-9606_t
MEVKERQVLNFMETFTHGYRTIPLHVHGKNDGIENLKVKEIKKEGTIEYASSKTKNPNYYYTSSSWNSEFSIYWYFPQTSGVHEYEFSYTVKRAIRRNEHSKELYWKLIPKDHPRMIKTFTSTINFEDKETKIELSEAFVNGDQNIFKQRSGFIQKIGKNTIEMKTLALFVNDYVEVKLIYDSKFDIEEPQWMIKETHSRFLDFYFFIFSFIYLIIPAVLKFIIYRDNDISNYSTFFDESELPSDLPPALASTLLLNYGTEKDAIATLVNLCRKGYLKIEDTGNDWIFQKVKSFSTLSEHEHQVVMAVFISSDNRVSLSSLNQKFYQQMNNIYDRFYSELKSLRMIHTYPDKIIFNLIVVGILFPVSSIFINIIQSFLGFNINMTSMIGLSFVGLILLMVMCYYRSFSIRTVSGSIEAKKWSSFKNYLKDVSNGKKNIDKSIYESYLPFAIAFGITGFTARWNEMFYDPQMEISTAPHWYYYTGSRDYTDSNFRDRFDIMCETSHKTFTSAPPSKSSSSSSSGGGSGGGGSMGFG